MEENDIKIENLLLYIQLMDFIFIKERRLSIILFIIKLKENLPDTQIF